jgi:predicted nucleic acid-binding protein
MRAAIDTNILAYAEGVNGFERRQEALDILRRLPTPATVVPVQALGELYNVLVRKAGRSAADALASVVAWATTYTTAETTRSALVGAAELAAAHRLGIWDSVMLAVAAENGCGLLLSEDLQDGFAWGGLRVVNPFAVPRFPLLDALLEDQPGGQLSGLPVK